MLAFGMPAGFTRDQIAAIAALAHLDLDTTEIDLFARQLGEILEYAEVVQQLDTAGVQPTSSVAGRHLNDRPDELQPSIDREEALGGAPDAAVDAGFFRVPRVLG
jgi:aspartyl-tRNA(Asn)/glutamyl-tRNA(Gln) amidotransferase subunit C